MNVMTEALKEAGVALPKPIPAIKRGWMWLKDHPRSTSSQVAAALGITHTVAASACTALADRKMAVWTKDNRMIPSTGQKRGIKVYSTAANMHEYELLPKPLYLQQRHLKAVPPAPQPVPKQVEIEEILNAMNEPRAPSPVEHAEASPKRDLQHTPHAEAQRIVDLMTVGVAREVWRVLSDTFK